MEVDFKILKRDSAYIPRSLYPSEEHQRRVDRSLTDCSLQCCKKLYWGPGRGTLLSASPLGSQAGSIWSHRSWLHVSCVCKWSTENIPPFGIPFCKHLYVCLIHGGMETARAKNTRRNVIFTYLLGNSGWVLACLTWMPTWGILAA